MTVAPRIAECRVEHWPLEQPFSISRGTKSVATVVVVEISDGITRGRGEATPYARYGETPESVTAALSAVKHDLTHDRIRNALPAGAARNALDCAWWDFVAKSANRRVWDKLEIPAPSPSPTFVTISLDEPEAMAARARELQNFKHLKLKLGNTGDAQRMRAVRVTRPDACIVVDANEGWHSDQLKSLLDVARDEGIDLVEQPLPSAQDAMLREVDHKVPICADEAAEPGCDIGALADRYDAVNIKLDKAGGLSAAMNQATEARKAGLKIFLGSMVATSLGIAPATLLMGHADWIDLDSPFLLARDRNNALTLRNGLLNPPTPELWG